MQERPREKALLQGMRSLSNRELIAIILRSGTKEHSVLDLADLILHTKKDLIGLLDLHIHDLMKINGIKEAKATQLMACFELCQRISLERVNQEFQEDSKPQILSEWLMHIIGHEAQEHFFVLFLNNRGKMIAHKDMFIGTGNKSFANPREVFLEALQSGCSKIICAHNHPSGNVTPSASDFISAKALEESGDLLGIKVVDHIIVSSRSYYSFREHLQMNYQKRRLEDDYIDSLKQETRKDIVFPST